LHAADPASPHLDDWSETRAELQIRAGAVHDLHVAFGHQPLLGIRHPHAVRRAQVRRRQAGFGEVLQVRQAT
jgi:hypothetical protein